MTSITSAVRLPRVTPFESPAPPTERAAPTPAPTPQTLPLPAPEAPPPEPAVLELVAVGLEWSTLGMVVLTAVTVSVLGPFGVIPAFLIGPLFLAAELTGWLAARGARAPEPVPSAEPVSAPAPTPARASAPARAAVEPAREQPARRPTLRTLLRERLREVAQVHHTLPTLLAAVKAQPDPLHVLLQLQALRRHLEDHFRAEEAPYGLFEELRTLSQDVEADLAVLADQHEAILADLQALTDLEAMEDPEAAAALPALERVLERIEQHQRNEDALVQQVYGFRIDGELGS